MGNRLKELARQRTSPGAPIQTTVGRYFLIQWFGWGATFACFGAALWFPFGAASGFIAYSLVLWGRWAVDTKRKGWW